MDKDEDQGAEAARAGFARQTFMATLGARLVEAGRGTTRIAFARNDAFCQQNGYLHAGVATAIADTACGFAARTLAPPGSDVLTIEFKCNFLRPASGEMFEARGRVVKPGSKITVCEAEVWETAPGSRLIVTMSATMFIVPSAPGVARDMRPKA